MNCAGVSQVIAYNKMDLADSSDYLEEVQEYMERQGLDPADVVAISAVTGRGVLDLVRRIRQVLDAVGEEVPSLCLRHLPAPTVSIGKVLWPSWSCQSDVMRWPSILPCEQ